jgi:hypothetical protein
MCAGKRCFHPVAIVPCHAALANGQCTEEEVDMNKRKNLSEQRREEIVAALPPGSRPVFDSLVADYRAAAHACTGKKLVKYDVIAELVRSGWHKRSVQLSP